MVERYSIYGDTDSCEMKENTTGEYVLFDSYKRLEEWVAAHLIATCSKRNYCPVSECNKCAEKWIEEILWGT